jgi:hypothetical protein
VADREFLLATLSALSVLAATLVGPDLESVVELLIEVERRLARVESHHAD